MLENKAQTEYSYQHADTPEARAKQFEEYDKVNNELDLHQSLKETFKDLPDELREELTSKETVES